MSFNHSASNCMRKKCSGAIITSLSFRIKLFKLFIRLKERSLEIFLNLFVEQMKDLVNVKPKKNPLPYKIPGYALVLGLNPWLFLLFT